MESKKYENVAIDEEEFDHGGDIEDPEEDISYATVEDQPKLRPRYKAEQENLRDPSEFDIEPCKANCE